MRDAKIFLNWELDKTAEKLIISQRKYCYKVIESFGIKPKEMVSTPLLPNTKLTGGSCDVDFDYRGAIGSLFYLVNCSRPDLAESVGVLSRSQASYGEDEVTAVNRVLQYVNSTRDFALAYYPGKFEVYCYVDSNLAATKSTTGYIIYLNGNPIVWKSRRQGTTALSSMEAEFVALSAAVSEILWIKHL